MLRRKRAEDRASEPVLEDTLEEKLGGVTRELAVLNRELASQMVLLASQTGDARPLIGAVEALRRVEGYYSTAGDPRAKLETQEALATTLLALGRGNGDGDALAHAVVAFRSAITLASLLGDDAARRRLREGYAVAQAAGPGAGGRAGNGDRCALFAA